MGYPSYGSDDPNGSTFRNGVWSSSFKVFTNSLCQSSGIVYPGRMPEISISLASTCEMAIRGTENGQASRRFPYDPSSSSDLYRHALLPVIKHLRFHLQRYEHAGLQPRSGRKFSFPFLALMRRRLRLIRGTCDQV